MVIKNYDDPFYEPPPEPPSDLALATRKRLIEEGIIPAQGKTPFTLELIQQILKTKWQIMGDNIPLYTKLLKKASGAFDTGFKLYMNYAKWMTKEIEVTAEFINKIMFDETVFIMGEAYGFVDKANISLLNRYKPPPTQKYLFEAIKSEEAGKYLEAVSFHTKAVECRADVIPLLKRGSFFYRHGRLNKAIADFSLAIKEALPKESYQAWAYADRARCYIAKEMIEDGIDDFVRAFGLFLDHIRSGLIKKLSDEMDEIRNGVEYQLEQCVPVIKSIDKNKESRLPEDEKIRLVYLKDLILKVRQKIDY